MMPPIFLINLEHHTARLRFMQSQFDALKLSVTRLSAANGKDPDVLARAAAAGYAPLSTGEIGCFESHRAIWQRIVDENLSGAFAIEDDVVIASDFGQLVFAPDILQTVDLIKVDQTDPRDSWYGTTATRSGAKHSLVRFLGSEASTACYFVTNKGARALLSLSEGYFIPVDRFLFDQDSRAFWKLQVLKLAPAAATQLRFFDEGDVQNHEIADSIQQNRAEEKTFSRFWNRQRIRLRRVLDNDTRGKRASRTVQQMQDAAKQEPLSNAFIPFETESDAHIMQAKRYLDT